MATHRANAFSVSHMAVLDGTTGAEHAFGDFYGVRSGAIAADVGNADLTGDDAVLDSQFWFNQATITITGGYISHDLIALITGTPVYDYVDLAAYTAGTFAADAAARTAAQASAGHIFEQELWPEQSMSTPTFPVLLRMPSRDSAGRVRLLDFVLYKVSFSPITFTGPSYKTYLEVNLSGRAVMSDRDETGTPLGNLQDGRVIKSVGRMVNRPG